MIRPLICAALICSAVLNAQSATYRFAGTGCTGGRLSPGIGPVPLSVSGTPRVGGGFDVQTEGSTNYPWGNRRTVFLLTGSSDQSAFGVPLPFDVAALSPGSPFCGLLRTSGEAVVQVPNTSPYTAMATVRFVIPNDPSLLGVAFHQQVLSIERSTFGPPFQALALSASGIGTIGR
jgi:hypothetical protein